MRARFGEIVLDTDARELRRNERPVELSAKGIELLALLVARRPEAVTQSELREALWADVSVGYTSLARVVSEVRKALGRDESFIRTVPRYGYAFAGEAVMERAPAAARSRYLLVAESCDFALPSGEALIGRGPECVVRLTSPGVSRVHARIRVRPGGAVLEDQDSKNGTWVNDARISRGVALQEGDEVVIGTDRLVFRSAASLESTRTAAPGSRGRRVSR